jgi:hypothetical protein
MIFAHEFERINMGNKDLTLYRVNPIYLVLSNMNEKGVKCCLNHQRTLKFYFGQHCRPPPFSSKSWKTKLIRFKPPKSLLNAPHYI